MTAEGTAPVCSCDAKDEATCPIHGNPDGYSDPDTTAPCEARVKDSPEAVAEHDLHMAEIRALEEERDGLKHLLAEAVEWMKTKEEADVVQRERVEREQRRKHDREAFYRMVSALGGGK